MYSTSYPQYTAEIVGLLKELNAKNNWDIEINPDGNSPIDSQENDSLVYKIRRISKPSQKTKIPVDMCGDFETIAYNLTNVAKARISHEIKEFRRECQMG